MGVTKCHYHSFYGEISYIRNAQSTKVYAPSDYTGGGGAFSRHFFTYILRLTTTLCHPSREKSLLLYQQHKILPKIAAYISNVNSLGYHHSCLFLHTLFETMHVVFSSETTCVVFFTLFKKYIRQRGTQISLSLG